MIATRVKLGELFNVKHGFAFKSEFFNSEGPYVLMTPGNFIDAGGFRDRGEKTKYYTGDVPLDYLLDEGELLVVMTEQMEGLLGSSALVPESGRYLHNQRLGRIVDIDDSRLNKHFLYYLFNTRDVRAQIAASASGTKVRHTAPTRIGEVEVDLPPIQTQARVAEVLAAYDDLIENNTRRIKLLEDAARLLYEEWFVRLRFPGHEHTPIHDGVPEGWKKKTLEEVGYLNYGKALKADARVAGAVSVFGSSGIVGSHEVALVPGPGIIVGRKGNVGSVHLSLTDFWPIDTVYYIGPTQFSYFLLHNLRYQNFINGDVAVPGLNRNFAHSLPVIFPSSLLANEFERSTSVTYAQIDKLRAMNEKLRQARDLLLPRLMSGEVAV